MKLIRKLQFLYLFLIFFSQLVVGKEVFPARGFSSILQDFEADQIVRSFRQSFFSTSNQATFHQAYLYQFAFIHYSGSELPVVHYGLLSGPSPESGLIRIDLFPDQFDGVPQTSFLLQREPNGSKAWKYNKAQNNLMVLEPQDWLSPWKEGVNHAPFDLLMPFISWPFEYEKSGRVSGRPAHLFKFLPSNTTELLPKNIKAVRMAIDDAYDAPLRIEHLDGGILPSRVFTLQSFKKVQDRWVVKAIDVKDRDSESRTRFELQAVAHGLDLSLAAFKANGLNQSINQSSISFISL